jgi:hypothetical protein
VGSKIGAAGQACEMPFGSKLIIKKKNDMYLLISINRILIGQRHPSPGRAGQALIIMQIIYQVIRISDF